MIILTDSNQSIKEELKEVIGEHVEETRLLKKIAREQLEELKIFSFLLMISRITVLDSNLLNGQ